MKRDFAAFIFTLFATAMVGQALAAGTGNAVGMAADGKAFGKEV